VIARYNFKKVRIRVRAQAFTLAPKASSRVWRLGK
jgi:hypothetical protein